VPRVDRRDRCERACQRWLRVVEVFLRRPEASRRRALQGCVGANQIDDYVAPIRQAFERVGPAPARIATSAWDSEHGTTNVSPGAGVLAASAPRWPSRRAGHDQAFLRELGRRLY